MAPSSSSSHLLVWALLYDNLLSSVCFVCSHPLYLSYLLYFSPCVLRLILFLFPLLLSTSTLLLLFSRHSILDGESAAVCLLDQLWSVVVDTLGDVFEWEFEAMYELYNNNVGVIGEVEDEECLAEISVENPARNGERVGSNGVGFEFTCEVGGDQIAGMGDPGEISCSVELPCEKSAMSEILEPGSGNGGPVDWKGCSFVPQTPDRTTEILSNSPLPRRARQRSCAFESLSRSGSMRARSMRITSAFYGDPEKGSDEMFWECTEKIELSKSRSEKGRSLERDGSTMKEKEWKRTLACKLYEERTTFKLCDQDRTTVVEGAEEMDLLWEAYEADADKANKFKNNVKNRKKEALIKEEDGEDEEGESEVGQVCCLHALRLSTGKMNLGVGRPNLSRMSRFFKGMSSLRRSSSSRSRQN